MKEKDVVPEPRYTLWQNVIYAYKECFKVYPCMCFLAPALVLVSVLLPIISNILPAIIIAMLEQGDIAKFLLAILGSGAVFAGAKWLENSLQRKNNIYLSDFRMKNMMLRYYHKAMTTSYQNVEPHGKQLDFQMAFWALNGDSWGIGQIFNKMPLFVFNTIGLITYASFLSSIDIRILFILMAMTISCLILEKIAYRYQKKTMDEERELSQSIYMLRDYSCELQTAKDIRMYGIENWFPKRMEELTQKRKKLNANVVGRAKLMDVSNNLFLVIRDITAYGLLIAKVLEGKISIAEFTFFIGIVSGFTVWLTDMINNYSLLRKASLQFGYLRSYLEMDDLYPQVKEDGKTISFPASIEFRDVTFTYPETDKPVLEHLNLKIQSEEKVALVGENGAGKTTIVKLLTGLYHPDSGEILLGGKNINSIPREEYFDLIGTVFQDPFLMAFSIEENIACCESEKADHEKVRQCLKRTGLWEKIQMLPQQEKTPYTKDLYQEGADFSGGEVQKLMLARALYKDAPVMVLDEPTAALDPLAEAEMYEKYNSLTQNKTSIFISHRLSSTQFCDRVMYLKDGKIIEQGTHQQLMKLGGGYAKMFEYQAYYYQKELRERPDEKEREKATMAMGD